jgi:MarR family transcriptional regulator, transcriptional regulator for hemolysin
MITRLIIGCVTDKPDILVLLHDLAHQLRLEADRRASAYGMTRAQWVILLRLERRAGLSQKELAEILEVEPITVARLIDRLERSGMVERRGDPDDRRIWRLHLREAALPVLAHLHGERDDILRTVAAGIDPALLDQTEAVLEAMKANVAAALRMKSLEEGVA